MPIRYKKAIRILLILLIPVVLLFGANYWLVANAENLLSEAVYRESNGTVSLKLDDISYNYRSHELKIRNAELTSLNKDTLTNYRFTVPHINLSLASLRQLIFHKKLTITGLVIPGPSIEVIRRSKRAKTTNVSLSTEMGRVYNAIRQALQRLQIRQMTITNASFVLRDETVEPTSVTTVSDIYFRIDNLMITSEEKQASGKPFFADNIVFKTREQKIDLPGGKHRIGFKSLSIDMEHQLLAIDSCYIESLGTSGYNNRFKANFDTIMLSRIDFGALYNSEILKADSVYCSAPRLEFEIVRKDSTDTTEKKLELRDVIQDIGTNMDFRYIGLRKASLDIRSGRRNASFSFSGQNRIIEFEGFRIIPDSTSPINIDRFMLEANDYESYSHDSLYLIRLRSIGLEDQALRLENVSISTHRLKPGMAYREHRVPLLTITGIDWQTLFFQKKIIADEVTLHTPTIVFRKRAGMAARPFKIYDAMDAANDLITVKRIRAENGSFEFDLGNGTMLNISGVTGSVRGRDLLMANNSEQMEESVEELYIDNAALKTNQLLLNIHNAHFDGPTATFSGNKLLLTTTDKTLSAEADNILLEKFRLLDSSLQISGVGWQYATIRFEKKPISPRPQKGHRPFSWLIEDIHGRNTAFLFRKDSVMLTTSLSNLHLQNLQQQFHHPMQWNQFTFAGDSLLLLTHGIRFRAGYYSIKKNDEILIGDPELHFSKNSTGIHLKADSLTTISNIAELLGGKNTVPYLNFYQPVFNITGGETMDAPRGTSDPTLSKPFPEFRISDMQWINPTINVEERSARGRFRILNVPDGSNRWTFTNIESHPTDGLRIDALGISDSLAWQPPLATEPLLRFRTEALLKKFRIPQKHGEPINFSLSQMYVPGLVLPGTNNKFIRDLRIYKDSISSAMFRFMLADLIHEPGWEASASEATFINNREKFRISGMNFQSSSNTASADSISYSPVLDKEAFISQQVFQTDYITVKSGKVNLYNPIRGADSLWTLDSVTIHNPRLFAARDKRLPFQHGVIKPLPAEMLRKIGFPLKINRLATDSMFVHYSEFNDKTNKEGTIELLLFKTALQNIATEPQNSDTLVLEASGMFTGSIPFSLFLSQPYLDSLETMDVLIQAGPGRLTNLNNFLPALASVYVKNGRFSHLSLDAKAGQETADGRILFRYHGLHIRVLKKGEVEKKAFITGLITFIADRFLLRTSNTHRESRFTLPRNQEKSVFNYLVKIVVKGAGTNTGILKEKKKKQKESRK